MNRGSLHRVVLTLSHGSIPGLMDGLRARGLQVMERPLLRFAPPEDWTPFDHALGTIDRYRAIAITSPRAALALVRRLPRKPCAVPAWTTGLTTAMVLRGTLTTVYQVHIINPGGAAEAVARAILQARRGSPVLFPCGDLHRAALVLDLESAGVRVEPVICYRTVLSPAEEAGRSAAGADLLIVGSPSVARLLADAVPAGVRPLLVAAGTTTARAAELAGWPPDTIARAPTADAVLEAFSQLQPL